MARRWAEAEQAPLFGRGVVPKAATQPPAQSLRFEDRRRSTCCHGDDARTYAWKKVKMASSAVQEHLYKVLVIGEFGVGKPLTTTFHRPI